VLNILKCSVKRSLKLTDGVKICEFKWYSIFIWIFYFCDFICYTFQYINCTCHVSLTGRIITNVKLQWMLVEAIVVYLKAVFWLIYIKKHEITKLDLLYEDHDTELTWLYKSIQMVHLYGGAKKQVMTILKYCNTFSIQGLRREM
jgi:hypothetical protein